MPRADAIRVAREFAENAEKTKGKSMILLGSGSNHWFHSDMAYRSILNLTHLCGCEGRQRRRIGSLYRPGKGATDGRLVDRGLCARLDQTAATANGTSFGYTRQPISGDTTR